jgi:hypothetical protein
MTFNENAYMIAGTAIAIGGVGLYIWDTRGSKMVSSFGSSAPQPEYQGGRRSRRHNKKHSRGKTKRN